MTHLITLPDTTNDISAELAKRAYSGTSFSPEKRAEAIISEYQAQILELAELVEKCATDDKHKEIAQEVFDYYHEGFKSKYTDWLNAKSNCISTMITGPANFPVRRAEKANAAEHKRCLALIDYRDNLQKYITKKFASVYTTQEKQGNEIEQMKAKIKQAETNQQFMKDANKAYRAFKKEPDSEKTEKLFSGFSDKQTKQIKEFVPEYSFDRSPFAPYQMQNNLANIKRMKQRLAELESKHEKAETVGSKDTELNGLTVSVNYEADRIQMTFDGKPDADVRAVLKKNAFKWSPKNAVWQRKITNNALYAVRKFVLPSEPFQQFQTQEA